ncbi:MAG: histidinol dehydrogenase [Thermoplasmataceae archaeon]
MTDEDTRTLNETVKKVLFDVRDRGDEAVREYTKKFDGIDLEKTRLTQEEIKSEIADVPEATKELIDTNISRIRKFAEFQMKMYRDMQLEVDEGQTVLGQKIVPIESVGIYVPAGRFPLLSSPLMSIIPAKTAGVRRIVAVTPPGKGRPDKAVLYGIVKAGADEIFTIGGIQAIGAMAYGTESLAPVDKIFGPGNKYVNEAKRQVFGQVGIDLLAGPSEVLIIADETANTDKVAYDLLAQAEHDTSARSCLVTTSTGLANRINRDMQGYINSLGTNEILNKSWAEKGEIVLCDTLDEAISYANLYAPEHLELHLSHESKEIAFLRLNNFGSLFMNEDTPVVFSDKLIGTNHTLPTNRASRYTGGLSVGAFMKILTYQEIIGKSARYNLSSRAKRQSLIEGLDGHAKSADLRSMQKDLEILI